MSTRINAALLAILAIVLVWSAIRPHDYFTWILEVFPALIAAIILLATYRRFPLTTLAYVLICTQAIILAVGGHYTYAEVPLGFWMQRAFGFTRNNYDRIGHFAQGFVPAIISRELLIRLGVVRKRGWLFFLVVCVCLAISAAYELLEWRVAVTAGAESEAFLGTQGDPWDTQEDMATALVGAIVAQLVLAPWHEREIEALSVR